MKHIFTEEGILCGAIVNGDEDVVASALQSDCDKCRAVLNIGPMKQKGCEVQPEPDYEPGEPLLDPNGNVYERKD